MRRAFPRGRAERPTWKHWLELLGLGLFSAPARWGGERLGRPWARFWGRLAFDLFRIRRQVTLENLRHAFPDRPMAWRLRVARAAYGNFAETFLEVTLLARWGPEEILRRCPLRAGEEGLREALERGRGAILLSGHFGNWELMGGSLALRGYPVDFLVRPQRNPLVDARLQAWREAMGVGIIPVGQAVRRVYRALRAGRFVAILADQDAGRSGLFLPFMGRLASTAVGPAAFAYRARCPIILGHCLRTGPGELSVYLDPPVWPREGVPEEQEVERLARIYTRRLEEIVRAHPEHWFWMHRRWKTRPQGEPGPALSGEAEVPRGAREERG
jgi:KDO2-lipid IV(A) lauroyltransferase